MKQDESPLPYKDTKTVGAADFYFAINATFRFLSQRFGREGLIEYWRDLGKQYFAPVTERWRVGGLPSVAEYWRAFYAAEPGADVCVSETPGEVLVDVRVCPAIKHLRENGRQILPSFCQHCYYLSDSIGETAGVSVRVEGGNGACRQRFFRSDTAEPPQDLARIMEARC